MTPKRSRSTSTRTKTSNKSLNPINNATTSDYNKEALNYEKQIRDLKKEITDYKKKVISLQTEIDVLRNQSSNSVKFNITDKNLLDQKNGKASPNSENKLKGCSCKGNCSNKICGCVKKNLTCQKFCRCNDVQCKNQESQKENISIEQMQLSKAGRTALEKLENLSLNQEALHASKKKVKRTMFKSHGSGNEVIEQDQIYPKNSKTIETKRRLFTQNSKELVDIDVDQDNVLTMKSDSLNKSFNNLDEFEVQAPQTPISKRTRNKKDLNGTMINNKQTKEKQSIPEKDENLEENMYAENTENFQVSETLMMTNKKTSSQEKIYFSNKQYNEDANSKQMLRKKSMSVSPDSCRKCKNIKVKSKSISPDKNINDHKNNDKKLSILNDVLHSSQPLRDPVQPVLYYKNNDREENEKIQENIKISTQENLEETLESDANENEVNINSEHNINLNPMVPKHELQRSPINLTGTKILPILNKRFSSPKKELAVAEINWEQHQSELIICKICKRKFFPHRIDKHLTFCKGI